MQQIWKYELITTDIQTIEMPIGAEVLTVQIQYGKPCIWALVDIKAEKEKRKFEVFETGHPIQVGGRKYIGTYQLHGGALIFHVFELSI